MNQINTDWTYRTLSGIRVSVNTIEKLPEQSVMVRVRVRVRVRIIETKSEQYENRALEIRVRVRVKG